MAKGSGLILEFETSKLGLSQELESLVSVNSRVHITCSSGSRSGSCSSLGSTQIRAVYVVVLGGVSS